jgi:hypothetical protein
MFSSRPVPVPGPGAILTTALDLPGQLLEELFRDDVRG